MTESNYASLQTPTANSSDLALKADERPRATKIASLSKLFSFADTTDYLLMATGMLAAVGSGLSQPAQMLFFGDIINSFNPTAPIEASEFRANINEIARNFAIVGGVVIVCGFLQVACWSLTASRQAKRIRSAYVNAILTQELS